MTTTAIPIDEEAPAPVGRPRSTHPPLARRTPFRAEDWFSADELAEARRYTRPIRRIQMAASIVSVIALVTFIAAKGGPKVLDWIGVQGWALQLTILVAVVTFGAFVISIGPAAYVKLVYDKRWGLSNETPKRFVIDQVKELLINVVLESLLFLLIYGAVRTSDLWFIWGWAGFMVLQIGLVFVYPVVIMPRFNKFTPLADGELRQRIEKVAGLAGTSIEGVYTMDASKRSSRGNAFVAGLGATKRVVLFDTILDYPTGEIEQIVAHEIGHYRLKHMFKSLPVLGGLFLVAFAFIGVAGQLDWLLHRAGVDKLGDPAALPLFLLLFGIAWSILGLGQAWFSRFKEREADLEALELLRRPDEFIQLWRHMAPKDKAELEPSWWRRLKASHPEVAERMAFGQAWAEMNDVADDVASRAATASRPG